MPHESDTSRFRQIDVKIVMAIIDRSSKVGMYIMLPATIACGLVFLVTIGTTISWLRGNGGAWTDALWCFGSLVIGIVAFLLFRRRNRPSFSILLVSGSLLTLLGIMALAGILYELVAGAGPPVQVSELAGPIQVVLAPLLFGMSLLRAAFALRRLGLTNDQSSVAAPQ